MVFCTYSIWYHRAPFTRATIPAIAEEDAGHGQAIGTHTRLSQCRSSKTFKWNKLNFEHQFNGRERPIFALAQVFWILGHRCEVADTNIDLEDWLHNSMYTIPFNIPSTYSRRVLVPSNVYQWTDQWLILRTNLQETMVLNGVFTCFKHHFCGSFCEFSPSNCWEFNMI